MPDDKMLLGQILANQKNQHEDILEIKKDVKLLNEFRWHWTGKMTAYTSLIGIVATILTEYFYHR
jgi:hypothetical protein